MLKLTAALGTAALKNAALKTTGPRGRSVRLAAVLLLLISAGACGPSSMSRQVEQIRDERYASYRQLEASVEELRREIASVQRSLRSDGARLGRLEQQTQSGAQAKIEKMRGQLQALKREERRLQAESADAAAQQALVKDIARLEEELRMLECEVFEDACL